jgi:hypothetical protein
MGNGLRAALRWLLLPLLFFILLYLFIRALLRTSLMVVWMMGALLSRCGCSQRGQCLIVM